MPLFALFALLAAAFAQVCAVRALRERRGAARLETHFQHHRWRVELARVSHQPSSRKVPSP